ncbi:MAG: O-antigen ligase family protein [Elusimicrobiota bacterium]
MTLLTTIFLGLALGGLRSTWAWTFAALLLWSTAMRRPPDLRAVPAARLWGAWLAWTALSALLSAEPLRGVPAFARSATALAVFALAADRLREDDRSLWFHLLCGAGVVTGLAALLIQVPSYPGVGFLYPYYNYTAALQAAVFAACLGAWGTGYARSSPWPRRGLLGALMVLALGVILWERSRGGLLAAAVATLFWLWRRGQRRLLLGLALAGFGLLAVAPIRVLAPVLKLDKRAAYVRPLLWKSAAAVAADHPIFGEGPGQFDRGFLRHNFPSSSGSWPTRFGMRSGHAHSELLQMAAETGLPGLGLFLAALLATWRRTRSRHTSPSDRALGASAPGTQAEHASQEDRSPGWTGEAARTAFVALFTHALVDNILALPALGWLYFSTLGVAASAAAGMVKQPRPADSGTRHTLTAYACMAGLALAAVSWWPGWAVRAWRSRAFEATEPAGIRWMERALRLMPEDPELWADLARLHLRRRPPDWRGALAALSEAERRDPTQALNPLMAAEILSMERRWDAVRALSERALALEPACPQARLLRAEALYHLGRKSEAAREFELFEAFGAQALRQQDVMEYGRLVLRYDDARRRKVRELFR